MKLYYLTYTYQTGVSLNDFEVVDYADGVVTYKLCGVVLPKPIEADTLLDESDDSTIRLWLLTDRSLVNSYAAFGVVLNKRLAEFEASIKAARKFLANLISEKDIDFKIVTAKNLYDALSVYPTAKIYFDDKLCHSVFVSAFDCDLCLGDDDIIAKLQGVKDLDGLLCAFKDRPFSLRYNGKDFQIIREV